ncbi:SipW-dependent-type signal peptide-containing protein [Leucobacter musarum]|uniref:SipW-dependent-type signal peptide-containing protein n=1 Tax=Leucobacter musarum TaxID=1930747 RepID=UPI0006A7E095|nr:SipW-dependent-type signal peptide-containing protein [Leucobacter musarum]
MFRRNQRTRVRGRRRASANWFTRVRALLAGALVLGVGSTLTLAAWTDSEYAQATFTASTFGIIGSTDGTNFSEHATGATAAALTFVATPTGMSPGVTTYAKYTVKTTTATNVGGTALMAAPTVTGSGLGTYLRYGVSTIDPAAGTACNATTFGTGNIVAANSALTTAPTATQALSAGGANAAAYCIAVTLPAGTANAAQGLNATLAWTITATSTS